MKVPQVSLEADYRELKGPIDRAIGRVLVSGHYILGPEVERFEERIASTAGVRHAVGVNSGTDAVLLALKALDVGPGDEVITVSFTFMGTAAPILLAGARPVFVDIDPHTFTMDVRQVQECLTPRTKAILPVHLYGQAAEMEPLMALSRKTGISIVEDMSQAIGATYRGKAVGTFGRVAAMSLYPTKNLGACGDGGVVLTNDATVAERVRRLRAHGASSKYVHQELGYNSRLDALQAALLSVKLSRLEAWTRARIQKAKGYDQELSDTPLRLPSVAAGRKHVYHLYVVRCKQRDLFRSYLFRHGIDCGIHYPVPIHQQPSMQSVAHGQRPLPQTDRAAAEVLSLPLYPALTPSQVRLVSRAIHRFFESHA